MVFYSVWMLLLLASVTMVTGLSVLPGVEPRLPPLEFRKLIPKFPPGPITAPPPHVEWPFRPPRYCTCQIPCCEPSRQKRSGAFSNELPALAALLNTPLVRHRRCCNSKCYDCAWLRRQRL